ncbi:MAG: RNA polymerase-binding protein DksA [Candidatus Acididesulfobacter guangdongensis]|uniref:RNA polymerase-binding protein DksA n=1 Tax=Acididesulfobacter guangdongensis TaxID=2597225 RepID=A0A519BFY4_ACIG2|nr:MAG: RNA polymerase-binding protein DksA [Candidatus Acididesulfobacter guangdongensis]
MNQEQLEHFRGILSNKLNYLIGEAVKTVDIMSNTEEENFPDPTDRATMESDRNFELRIRDRERKLIPKIQQAIERINDGTYGICIECGQEISVKRLESRPETAMCIQCKTKEEEFEKKYNI